MKTTKKQNPKKQPNNTSNDQDSQDHLHNVYDKFYKTLFSYNFILEVFVNIFFSEIAEHLDFKNAQQLKTTFIKSNYTDREADIIYSIPIADKKIYIYILIEHQSKPDAHIFLRLLDYQLSLWNELIRTEKAEVSNLPPIIPIVLYNGKANWGVPFEFKKSFQKVPDVLLQYTPDFKYLFVDVLKLSDELIQSGDEFIKCGLMLDKNRSNIDEVIGEFVKRISKSDKSFQKLKDNLIACYYFILYHTKLNPNQLEVKIEDSISNQKIIKELEKMSKSAAIQLIEQGIEQGIEKGREKGREEGLEEGREEGREQGREEGIEKGIEKATVEMTVKLLKEKVDIQFIKKITGLSKDKILKLKSSLKK